MSKRNWLTVPNIITIARLPLTVVILVLLFEEHWQWAMMVYIVTALSDMLDGYIARKFNQITAFGALIDPIIDKVFIIGIMIGLSLVREWIFLPSIILIAREVWVAIFLYRVKKRGVEVEVSDLGRIKTVIQSMAYMIAFVPTSMITSGFSQVLFIFFALSVGISFQSANDYYNTYRNG